jgi:hypothetical protein
MEPVSERQEEDPTLTQRGEDDLSPSTNQEEYDDPVTSSNEPTKLVIQKQDSSEEHSHGTHSTNMSTGSSSHSNTPKNSSSGSSSHSSTSSSKKDHFIEVHCKDGNHGSRQVQTIQMDGSV